MDSAGDTIEYRTEPHILGELLVLAIPTL